MSKWHILEENPQAQQGPQAQQEWMMLTVGGQVKTSEHRTNPGIQKREQKSTHLSRKKSIQNSLHSHIQPAYIING